MDPLKRTESKRRFTGRARRQTSLNTQKHDMSQLTVLESSGCAETKWLRMEYSIVPFHILSLDFTAFKDKGGRVRAMAIRIAGILCASSRLNDLRGMNGACHSGDIGCRHRMSLCWYIPSGALMWLPRANQCTVVCFLSRPLQ